MFKSPFVLILIPVCLAVMFFVKRRQQAPSLRFSSLKLFSMTLKSWKVKWAWLPDAVRVIAVVCVIIALAGPRNVLEETVIESEGIDIVLAVDVSTSMKAEDFKEGNRRKNRLDVVKQVVEEFVTNRPYDQIGLIAFAAQAYTVCPLTNDEQWLTQNLQRVDFGFIQDGTAIGSAISSALSRLGDSSAKSKIIVLLTDGESNAGTIDPIKASQAAAALGIKIYTIGVGTDGLVPYPVQDFFGNRVYRKVQITMDEESLKTIADNTGGQYYRATDTEELRKIYEQIDLLEKTEIEIEGFFEYKELYRWFLLGALAALILELILRNTVFVRIP